MPQDRRSPLVLWHLLSLDAPTVATVWTIFIAWAAGLRISVIDAIAMFLAVWMLYATDRLLDANPLSGQGSAPELELRHHFHHKHRGRYLFLLLVACPPLIYLLWQTETAVLHLYLVLTGLLFAWLLLVHALPGPLARAQRLPKEVAVGIFFPAAVFIPTVARAPALRLALLPQAVLFACVCTLNCLFLYLWEHPTRRSQAHATTRWGIRHIKTLALGTTLAADALFLASVTLFKSAQPHWMLSLPHAGAAFLALSFSSALLLVLHACRHRLDRTTLRALADLVLLTPVPVALTVALWLAHR